jgi:hypothetical protein
MPLNDIAMEKTKAT